MVITVNIACTPTSTVEACLLNPTFGYHEPWFYNHPYALRCELGQGDEAEAYLQSAQARAEAIAAILFAGADGQPDAIFCDIQTRRDGHIRFINDRLRARALTARYRRRLVHGLPLHPFLDPEDNLPCTRYLYYRDGDAFDIPALIRSNCFNRNVAPVSLVSFANECILSVYDDRGCDIVFATPIALVHFYGALEPYFLDYDRAEMARRYDACQKDTP